MSGFLFRASGSCLLFAASILIYYVVRQHSEPEYKAPKKLDYTFSALVTSAFLFLMGGILAVIWA